MSAPAATASALSPAEARRLFPGLDRMTYFATNGQALLPQPTRDAIVAATDRLMRSGYGGAARLEAGIDGVRGQVAALLGATPEEVAFVRNTGEGLCLVADLVDWRPGDEVLCFAGEYRSIVHAFQGVAHRGVRVRVADLPVSGCVTAADIAAQLRDSTRAVVLSWVRYDNGARADLVGIGRVLADAGALFVVDAIQALGALPIDVRAARISFLCAGAHKWLLGTSGTGIFYIDRDVLPTLIPTHLGVTSMSDADTPHVSGDPYPVDPVAAARRVEEGSRNLLGITALGASLALLDRVGIGSVAAQIRQVSDAICHGAAAKGATVRSPRDDGSGTEGRWSGIFLIEPARGRAAADLARELVAERIMIGCRERALWGSVHYFNDLSDAERLVSFL